MFNLKNFIVTNIVNGVKNGTFTKEYANIMAVNYLIKGILTTEDVMEIDAQITAWEEEKAKAEEPIEPPVEEPTENPVENPVMDPVEEPVEGEIEEPVEKPTETENTQVEE